MEGDRDGTPPIEQHRDYLVLLARVLLEPKFRRQLDPSDIAQEALLRAHKAIQQYRGNSVPELRSWLRQILVNLLKDKGRTLSGPAHDVDLEQAFEQALCLSSARLEAWLCASSLGPEAQTEREEQLDRIARAINSLPEDQRTAVEDFYIHGYKTRDIAQRMGPTQNAVGALITRGVTTIREKLAESS